MKKSHDFLFGLTLAVILAGVLLSFSNTGFAGTGRMKQACLALSAIVKSQTP